MSRRLIALYPGSDCWHYAILRDDNRDGTRPETGYFDSDVKQPLTARLEQEFGPLLPGDRFATLLPASAALVRQLSFPFSDARKIGPALAAQMQVQLPDSLDQRALYHLPQNQGRVLAAAVSQAEIEAQLKLFDDSRAPLAYLGLAPFSLLPAYQVPPQCLLFCVIAGEASLCQLRQEEIRNFLHLGQLGSGDNASLVAQLRHQSQQAETRELLLIGIDGEDERLEPLRQAGFVLHAAELKSGDTLPPEQQLTVALAQSERQKPQQFNLRSGDYNLKTDWQRLRGKLLLSGSLLLVALLLLGAGQWLSLRHHQHQLQIYQRQMKDLYHLQYPGEKLNAPPLLLLESKRRALLKRQGGDSNNGPGPLRLLQALSQTLQKEFDVEFKELNYTQEGVRIQGSVASFDLLSKLLSALQKNPLLQATQIVDSKQTLDGQQVDFQLQLSFEPPTGGEG